jgi:hypothetical protein
VDAWSIDDFQFFSFIVGERIESRPYSMCPLISVESLSRKSIDNSSFLSPTIERTLPSIPGTAFISSLRRLLAAKINYRYLRYCGPSPTTEFPRLVALLGCICDPKCPLSKYSSKWPLRTPEFMTSRSLTPLYFSQSDYLLNS